MVVKIKHILAGCSRHAGTYHNCSSGSNRLLSFEVHKAQGAHADHTALLNDDINRLSTMLQQLTHQISHLGDTLETKVCISEKTIDIKLSTPFVPCHFDFFYTFILLCIWKTYMSR